MTKDFDILVTRFDVPVNDQITLQDAISKIPALIDDYKTSHGYDDLSKITQNQYNALLIYLYHACIKYVCIYKKTTHVKYNITLLSVLCDVYIDLCMQYDKDVSLYMFTQFVSIHRDSIYKWHDTFTGNNRKYIEFIKCFDDVNRVYGLSSERVSFEDIDVYEKIYNSRQESLQSKLTSGKNNPVGVLAILNHFYGWTEQKTEKTVIIQQVLTDARQDFNAFRQVDENKRLAEKA